MKRFAFGLSLVLSVASLALAQNSKNATDTDSRNSASLGAATSVSAQLESSLDVRKAKVGDEVILKANKSVKENGQTVIQKGSTLIGRVTEVQERTKGMAASKLGVVFHTLNQSGQNIPVNASITSITRASAYSSVGNDDTFGSTSAPSSTRSSTQTSSSSSSGGGLLPSVGSTVGGVVNTTTSTVSDVARTTGDVVGATATNVGRTTGIVSSNIPGLQVTNSTDASVNGGSTFVLSGNNLRLEKGTNFNLNVHQSGSIDTSQKKNPGN